ncbi:MAG: dihydropteroate synthase [Pseudomonadota bacterium]
MAQPPEPIETESPGIARGFSSSGPAIWAGLTLDRPRLMGIVNVTPDSFSDGGQFVEASAAIDQGMRLVDEGADIIDVGGESTRPRAEPVAPGEEIARVVPVIEALARAGGQVSVDTRHAETMAAAIDAGAAIVNDVTALTGDSRSLSVVSDRKVPVVLMHMRGDPRTMQGDPRYGNVVEEIRDYLAARIAACTEAGISPDQIAIDPGIGFGKTVDHNLALLNGLPRLASLGRPLLVGASRKSFIGKLSRGAPATERLSGSIAAALFAVRQGASLLRVHDVAQTRQALDIWHALNA